MSVIVVPPSASTYFFEVGGSGLLVAGFILLTLGRCLAAMVAGRELRLLALLSRLLIGGILVRPCLGALNLLPLVSLTLRRLQCLLPRLVFLRLCLCLRLRPCLLPVRPSCHRWRHLRGVA